MNDEMSAIFFHFPYLNFGSKIEMYFECEEKAFRVVHQNSEHIVWILLVEISGDEDDLQKLEKSDVGGQLHRVVRQVVDRRVSRGQGNRKHGQVDHPSFPGFHDADGRDELVLVVDVLHLVSNTLQHRRHPDGSLK